MRIKRVLLALLCSIILFGVMAVSAFADTPQSPDSNGNVLATEHFDFIEGDIAYKKVNDTEVEVAIYKWVTPPDATNPWVPVYTGYDGDEVSIPASVNHENVEYTVVGLAVDAFSWSAPKSITLPDSENFTYISEKAFMNVELNDDTTLTIPASVTDIGPSAFANSNITSITFKEGSNLKNIGRQAFDMCDEITSLTLPDTVESIGYAAFAGTGLTEITIPANAVIDAEVFNGFYGEGTTITFATGSQYQIKDGVLYSSDTLLNVLELEESVEIPEGIKYIGDNAFGFHMTGTESYRNILKSVTFPSTLVSIGKNAFCSNKALTSITIPASVTYIGDSAFKSCSGLESVTFEGNGLTEISDGMFAGCTSLVSIDIPEGVTKIGDEAFGVASTTQATPCTSLTTVNLPETVKSIGKHAFGWCSALSDIELPSSLTEIGPFAFLSTAITSAVVPEGVTEIPQGTFANCTQLKTLVLPSTLTSVGSQALQGALQAEGSLLVMQGETPPSFDNSAFNYGGTKPEAGAFTVIVPSGSEENYKNNTVIGTVVSGTDDKPTPTYSLDLSKYSINVIEGKTDSLIFTFIAPEGYKLIIENSNYSVAEIMPNENTITVKALKNGTATISVSIVSEDKITLVTKSCNVVVGASYTVTVVYGNGTADGIEYISQGESYKLPSAPTKPGYIFMGWRGADGVTYQPGDEVAITGDTSFKAIWANMPDITPGTPDEPDDEPDVDVFPFYDVSAGAWYYDAVKYAWEHELMNGVTATEFSPNTTLNRAMIWTMLARLDGVNTDGGASWYAKAQEWAMAEGVSDGTDPMGAVTREQLVTMLWRFKGEPTVDFLLTAKDADTVSSWAYEAMRWAVAEGIIEGDENGLVTPTATATRAQAAAIFMRFIEG